MTSFSKDECVRKRAKDRRSFGLNPRFWLSWIPLDGELTKDARDEHEELISGELLSCDNLIILNWIFKDVEN